MLLHQQFVRMAKKHAKKLAIKDKTTKSDVTYNRALIGALILAKKFQKYEKGYIGIMIPTSAGCALATVGALMSGRVPVMINYSTGAENNARYAQDKCSVDPGPDLADGNGAACWFPLPHDAKVA